jgi:two-component system phosphate regulon response regulator OmpR
VRLAPTARLLAAGLVLAALLGPRAGEVVPREELAAQGSAANDRTVDVQMNRLRRKIERDQADPLYLQTVRGVGYRLVTDRA